MTTLVSEATTEDVPEGKRLVSVMNEGGDVRVMWDPDDADSVALARSTFAEGKAKGLIAYAVKRNGDKDERHIVREFDPEAEKLILAPALVGG